jgi:hypothetical protein
VKEVKNVPPGVPTNNYGDQKADQDWIKEGIKDYEKTYIKLRGATGSWAPAGASGSW